MGQVPGLPLPHPTNANGWDKWLGFSGCAPPDAGSYNRGMARGWESKSVESQQLDSAAQVRQRPVVKPDPAYLDMVRKKETLILSRTRVKHELEASRNPRYRDLLNHALADLETQLSELSNAWKARAASA